MNKHIIITVIFVLCSCFQPVMAEVNDNAFSDFLAHSGETPESIIDAVKGKITFSPYSGFIKGPIGALWEGCANSADTAELILNAFREKGFETRLAFGILDDEMISELLNNAFPAASYPKEIQDSIPGESVSDPVNNPGIREQVSNHVWVQLRKDEVWHNYDPFLAKNSGTASVLEAQRTESDVPPEERRLLKIEVFVKIAGSEPASRLLFERPLSELTGKPLAFFNSGVASQSRNTRAPLEKLRPIIIMDGEIFEGNPYGGESCDESTVGAANRLIGIFDNLDETVRETEIAPKSPLVEDIFLEYTLFGAQLPEMKRKRYIYIAGTDGIDTVDELTSLAVAFGEPPRAFQKNQALRSADLIRKTKDEKIPLSGTISSEHTQFAENILNSTIHMTFATANLLAAFSHRITRDFDAIFGTISHTKDARISCISFGGKSLRISSDLLFDHIYPEALAGAKALSSFAMAGARGLYAARIEGAFLKHLSGDLTSEPECLLTVEQIFKAAREQNIAVVALLPPGGQPESESQKIGKSVKRDLSEIQISKLGLRILEESFSEDKLYILPEKPVDIAGKKMSAWYEIDRVTGNWTGVMETGRNQAMMEYKNLKRVVDLATTWAGGFWGGFCNTLFSFANRVIEVTDDDPAHSWNLIKAAGLQAAATIDTNNNIMQAFGDIEGILILGSSDPAAAMLLGQAGLMMGQVAGIRFLETQLPK